MTEERIIRTPEEVARERALLFFHSYCEENEFFTGGDVLEAWRATGEAGSKLDWRNKWASQVVKEAERRGWIRWAGRVVPKSKQSHTGSLTQWQSNLYKGVKSIQGFTARDQLNALKKQFRLREIDLDTLVTRAYELGVEVKG